jgi:hypothetical protein
MIRLLRLGKGMGSDIGFRNNKFWFKERCFGFRHIRESMNIF